MTERALRREVRSRSPTFIHSGGGYAGWLWLMEEFSPEAWTTITSYCEGPPSSGVVFASFREAVHAQIEALRTT